MVLDLIKVTLTFEKSHNSCFVIVTSNSATLTLGEKQQWY